MSRSAGQPVADRPDAGRSTDRRSPAGHRSPPVNGPVNGNGRSPVTGQPVSRSAGQPVSRSAGRRSADRPDAGRSTDRRSPAGHRSPAGQRPAGERPGQRQRPVNGHRSPVSRSAGQPVADRPDAGRSTDRRSPASSSSTGSWTFPRSG